jgi:hypothetical protein
VNVSISVDNENTLTKRKLEDDLIYKPLCLDDKDFDNDTDKRRKKEEEMDIEMQRIYLNRELEDVECIGGILLTTMDGLMTCKNTLDVRIQLTHHTA